MSFARIVPSTDVLSIHSRANDVEQELTYTLRGAHGEEDYLVPAWRADRPATQQNDVCILHYAVNRPAGAQWGEPDLAPVLRWLARYSAWLEDRVRLNHFRNAFVYVVKARLPTKTPGACAKCNWQANRLMPGRFWFATRAKTGRCFRPNLKPWTRPRTVWRLRR